MGPLRVRHVPKGSGSAVVTQFPCGVRVAPMLSMASARSKDFVSVSASRSITNKTRGMETRCIAGQKERACRSLK